ncbi:hypothetical protein FBU59_003618 [Linderina macrospora]|uniref:Uncharacterized protein n=1 Tax=Linderina macrospora TaxID=4868 RepID=A0ACC1J846_9FUNG|nr:hypothetical protein FBU59_003618 [Linderina macrospora]
MRFTATAFLASTALAQQQQIPEQRMQDVLSFPSTSHIAPQAGFLGTQPNIPISNVEAAEPKPSALDRLASYFGFSHISSEDTFTLGVIQKVFGPATRKFTHLLYSVVQNGDAYYVPVCSVDSIVQAGLSVIPASASCQYGIQLTPVPRNAARLMFRVMHAVFRLPARIASPLSIILGDQPGSRVPAFDAQF